MKNKPSFLFSRYNSFKFAFKGLAAVFRHEPNMHLHVIASIAVLIMAYRCEVTRTEWCILIFCIGLVWMAETFNTALETLTNLVSPEHNALAGKTKDLAAGAVLLAAVTAAVIGIIVFLPYWLVYFSV